MQTNTQETPKSLVRQFVNELLDSVDSFSSLVDAHGLQSLLDVMQLQAAMLVESFIVIPEHSATEKIIRKLPSGGKWMKWVKVDPTELAA